MAAPACHFNDRAGGGKALSGGNRPQTLGDGVRSGLVDPATGLTNHENDGFAGAMGRGAGNEGVEALEPVDEALRPQKIERAVDGNRGWRFLAIGGNPLDQIIGADGSVRGVKRCEHGTAQGRQLFAPSRAALLRRSKGSGSTGGLIMRMGAIMMGVVMIHDVFLTCAEACMKRRTNSKRRA